MKLTKAEAKMLLSKYSTGEFAGGANRNITLDNLRGKGLIKIEDARYTVTDSGKAWCFDHHMEYLF